MTSTNRGLNRLLLAFSGILLLATGTAAALVAIIPEAPDRWREFAGAVVTRTEVMLSATPLAASGVSWMWLVLLVVIALLVVGLGRFIVRQGRGSTSHLLDATPTDHGQTRVDAAFAEQALEQALAGQAEFLGVHASTYRVNGASMLRVGITTRRGAAPLAVISTVEKAVRGLDHTLGTEIPVLVQIGGGFRSRIAGPVRLGPADYRTPHHPQTSPASPSTRTTHLRRTPV
ncbi:hypothetical protein D6T64_16825 [Cryobacterium melibiosiphilum]|uniref:Alkaline shock response membrane anchor protein AmaP n=1 Tax=Cryobacterium melibiosiphilum TaxID=995039 RepID=A0A3A5MNH0_9MICO|nr:hypothetical protein [Cryobacterium melibiosiphilum]RJT87094.1 hypothetical protein D6T64_16825 [Cryobacterium melibiosiphilum]